MITLRQLHAWLDGSRLFGNPDTVVPARGGKR